MPKSRPAYLFDLDGTLIHSAPDVTHAINHIFSAEGLPTMTVEQVTGYLGKGARILMEEAVADLGGARAVEELDRMTADFLAYYAAHPVVHSHLFPGVIETLEILHADGAHLAICTNKPSATTAPVLAYFDLPRWFDAVVCADQVPNRKPHGDHVLETLAACGGTASRAVMIGDSDNDILAARNAGVPSVAVSYGYSTAPVETLGANAVIDSFYELPAVLRSLI